MAGKPRKATSPTERDRRTIERIQTGVRIEKRMYQVLKALAEIHDLSLGDLLEGIVLHAFEGKAPFSPRTRQRVGELARFYGLTLTAADSHRLRERPDRAGEPHGP